jgi:hypothetical protein
MGHGFDDWRPSGDELAAILEEMRPIVAAFVRRDSDRLTQDFSDRLWRSVAAMT